MQRGFTMIAAGFGSFAIFDGLATIRAQPALPKAFALGITAIGVLVILAGYVHEAPKRPDERRVDVLTAAAVVIGVISFIALLRLS